MAPDKAEKEPAGTNEHCDAPCCAYVPGEHKMHDDALVPPGVVRYVPAAHCVHNVAPAALQVPAAHCVGADDLDAHAEPAGQAVHDAALVPPAVVLYVPAAHCVHDVAPAALQEPAGHRAADVGACVVDVQA